MKLVHEQKPAVPRDKLIEIEIVCALCSIKRSTVYSWLKDPSYDFPRPVHLGARIVRWSEADVLQWVQNRIHHARSEKASTARNSGYVDGVLSHRLGK